MMVMMMSKKRFEEMDFNQVIIDVTGRQYSLKKKDDKIDVPILCKLILTRARQGATLKMILSDCGIRYSKWLPFVKRNKKIRTAIEDASHFHKAHGQRLLSDMAKGETQHSPVLAKVMMASFYDIKELYDAPATRANKSNSGYKVITTMTKEEVVKEEDKNG